MRSAGGGFPALPTARYQTTDDDSTKHKTLVTDIGWKWFGGFDFWSTKGTKGHEGTRKGMEADIPTAACGFANEPIREAAPLRA